MYPLSYSIQIRSRLEVYRQQQLLHQSWNFSSELLCRTWHSFVCTSYGTHDSTTSCAAVEPRVFILFKPTRTLIRLDLQSRFVPVLFSCSSYFLFLFFLVLFLLVLVFSCSGFSCCFFSFLFLCSVFVFFFCSCGNSWNTTILKDWNDTSSRNARQKKRQKRHHTSKKVILKNKPVGRRVRFLDQFGKIYLVLFLCFCLVVAYPPGTRKWKIRSPSCFYLHPCLTYEIV